MHSCVVGTVAFGTGLCRQTTNKNLDKQRAKVTQNFLELIFSTNSTVSVVMADRPAAGIRCHGRVYVRNVPVRWSWKDVVDWIATIHLPKPTFVKMLGRGRTVSLAIAIGTRVSANFRRSVTTWIVSTWPIAGWKPQSVWTWEPIPRQCLLQQQLSSKMWALEHRGVCGGEGGISTRFHRLNCTILTWDALAVAYLPPVQFAL